MKHSLQVFESPQFEKLYSAGATHLLSRVEKLPDEEARGLIEATVGDVGRPLTSEQILAAFRAGHLAYDLIPNVMPLTLFILRLPIVDPENVSDYLIEGDRALQGFKLSRAWYSWVEHGKPPANAELQFYVEMRQEFAARNPESRA